MLEGEPVPPRERVTYIALDNDPRIAEADLPPVPEVPEPPKPEDRIQERELLPEPPKPEKKKEKEKEPEPEPEPEPPPEPEPEPEPEKPHEFVLEQLKMVEQPDQLDEEDSPQDYDYLSNINRDVTEQTRAEITNLQQDAIETKAQPLEPSEETKRGTANETKIAEDEEKKSQLANKSPNEPPSPVEQRPEQNDPQKQSLLSMREVEHRDHKLAQDAWEALANEADDGQLRATSQEQASIAKQDAQARIDRKDPRYAFKLRHRDLDAAFGKTIDAQKREEAKRQSKTKGIWQDQQAHWQSPLENMIPEVQVGNQT